jgi:hypothetical protein
MGLSGATIGTYRPQYRPLSAIRYLDVNPLPTRYTLFITLCVGAFLGGEACRSEDGEHGVRRQSMAAWPHGHQWSPEREHPGQGPEPRTERPWPRLCHRRGRGRSCACCSRGSLAVGKPERERMRVCHSWAWEGQRGRRSAATGRRGRSGAARRWMGASRRGRCEQKKEWKKRFVS